MKIALRVLIAIALSPYAVAHPHDAFSAFSADQRDNLSSAYARCAAYFTYAWKGLARSGKKDGAKLHEDLAKSAMSTSYQLAAGSRSSEMAHKVVEARLNLYVESMSNDIGQDFANISVIVNKYGKSCMFAAIDPSSFAREYLRRPDTKP
jgi:hypothetical protein